MTLEKWKFLRLFFKKIYEVTGIGIDDSLILKIFLQRIGGETHGSLIPKY